MFRILPEIAQNFGLMVTALVAIIVALVLVVFCLAKWIVGRIAQDFVKMGESVSTCAAAVGALKTGQALNEEKIESQSEAISEIRGSVLRAHERIDKFATGRA